MYLRKTKQRRNIMQFKLFWQISCKAIIALSFKTNFVSFLVTVRYNQCYLYTDFIQYVQNNFTSVWGTPYEIIRIPNCYGIYLIYQSTNAVKNSCKFHWPTFIQMAMPASLYIRFYISIMPFQYMILALLKSLFTRSIIII